MRNSFTKNHHNYIISTALSFERLTQLKKKCVQKARGFSYFLLLSICEEKRIEIYIITRVTHKKYFNQYSQMNLKSLYSTKIKI